ncbi:Nicotinamidase-related amidase [Pedococcus dokdonensis]|uniref:Nicotinamidase-related amidase n=1 Tax=Pedococcus dokdonensis TaxID=443156 RepID=A0A1H0T0W9_9MICO|nr:isochorismatase family protein [Pedococcus dokdonensis]SDP47673.1 Nicotinamidase-related amidase [Pedococcus dokdonensis]
MTDRRWLVAVDFQRVFGDPSSAWCAPRYAAAAANTVRLAGSFGDRALFTRFVAPAEPTGAWVPYYEEFPWALEPPDSRLYELTDEVAPLATRTVAAPTFGKWDVLRDVVGDQPSLVVAGVATDCCVISTVLAAADAGASITVVTDACAGSTDDNHQKALDVMALYAPLVTQSTTDELLGSLG